MIAESDRRVEEDDSCAENMLQVGDRIQSKEKKKEVYYYLNYLAY